MDRSLIETPHREQDCRKLAQILHAQGDLMHFDWGCPSGVHTGWAVIEANSLAEARMVVPPLVRGQAHVVKVSKSDAATLARAHVDELAPQSLAMIRMNAAFPCWW
jgi:hypothetical protein